MCGIPDVVPEMEFEFFKQNILNFKFDNLKKYKVVEYLFLQACTISLMGSNVHSEL